MNKQANDQLTFKKTLIKNLIDRKRKEMEAFENVQERRQDQLDVEEGEPADWYENKNDQVARRMELHSGALEELTIDTRRLEEMDMEETLEEVAFGAVVETSEGNYIVAVPATDIEADGKTFTGVSVKSPFFQAIKGKKTGDSFSFQDRDFTINAVY